MNKIPTYLLLLFIFLSPLYSITQAENPVTFKYEYLTKIILPAVAVSTNGEGVVSKLEITVAYPGTGQIFFSAEPLTMLDSQASARIAVLVASNLLGLDYKKYDFMIALKSPSLIIGGPSAGGVMTIGVLAALTNKTIDNNVAMTGMINPDGTIGPVGGIPEKLKAAAQEGYKIFLIPAGQEIVYDEKIVKQSTPIGYITQIQRTPVNLTELGEQLGVKVIEVATIEEAAYYFLHLNLTKPQLPNTEVEYSPEQEKLFTKWFNKIEERINITLYSINEYLSLETDKNTLTTIMDYLNTTNQVINEAKDYYEKKMYYTAVSKLFNAAVNLETLYIQLNVNGNYTLIQQYINQTNQTITSCKNKLEKLQPDTMTKLEAYITASERLSQAQELLDKAINSIVIYKNLITGEEKPVIQDIQSLALAKWRALTTELWLDYSNITSPYIDITKLKDTSEYLMYYAETVLSYYGSLGGEQTEDYQTLLELYQKARENYDNKNYPGTISNTIYIIAYATTGIHQLYNTELTEITKAVINRAQYNLIISKYKSAIAMGYLESSQEYYKEYLETSNKNMAIQSLKLALLSSLYAELSRDLPQNNTSIQVNNSITSTTTLDLANNTNTTTNASIEHFNIGVILIILSLIGIVILLAIYRQEI